MIINKPLWISVSILILISIFSFTIMNSSKEQPKLHYLGKTAQDQNSTSALANTIAWSGWK